MRGAIHRHNSIDVFRFQGIFILVYFRLQVRLFRLHLAELRPQRLSTLFGTRETFHVEKRTLFILHLAQLVCKLRNLI